MTEFIHLHVHSQYSIADGHSTYDDYIEAAKRYGQRALAVTDHGNMAAAIGFYQAAREAGIKPLIGTELYVDLKTDPEQRNRYPDHLTVVALDEQGYRDLVRANTEAHKNFYYRPRLPLERLVNEGLMRHWMVLSGCLRGTVPALLEADNRETAVTLVEVLRSASGYFGLEVMYHPPPDVPTDDDVKFDVRQIKLLQGLDELSHELDVPLVLTNDCHYATAEAEAVHQGWLRSLPVESIQHGFWGSGYELASSEKMTVLAVSLGHAEAATNAGMLADLCEEYELPEVIQPRWHVPELDPDPEKFIRDRVEAKLLELSPEYRERFEREMTVLGTARHIMSSYLIAHNVVGWCRRCGIPVFCRGSMAGSIVSWLLGITHDDPVRWRLMFERAVNPARPTIPDFDIDVSSGRRREVLRYIAQEFSESTLICSFTGYSPRGAFRSVLSAERLSPSVVTKTTRGIPEDWSELWRFDPARDEVVAGFKGLYSSVSVHPAGVIISDKKRPLGHEVPAMWVASSKTLGTQFDMYALKKLRLFKLDVLGLKALDQLDLMENLTGVSPPDDYDDPGVLELFNRGMTAEVFQFDGRAARSVALEVGIGSFEDLVAVNALARPGGALGVSEYKEGYSSRLTDLYPPLRPVLEYSRGVFIYQEQAMEACHLLAGFDDAAQDDLKEAMKSGTATFDELAPRFAAGCQANGWDGTAAWNAIELFADYGFNRAHAVSYSGLAYRMAWYKRYHPQAYYAAVLDDSLNRWGLVAESLEEGVRWALPDINKSGYGTTIEGDVIRLGLGMIKGIGIRAVSAIVAARPIKSVEDLTIRADKRACNARVRKALVAAGAFDGTDGGHVYELFGFDPTMVTPEMCKKVCVHGRTRLGGFIVEVKERTITTDYSNWSGRKAATVVVAGPGYKEQVWVSPDQLKKAGDRLKKALAVVFEGTWAEGNRAFKPRSAEVWEYQEVEGDQT